MKKNKRRIIIIGVVVIAIIAILCAIFINQENRLTGAERQWVTNNQNTVQNINIVNNANIFGDSGVGVYYNFLNSFREEYELQMNPVTLSKGDNPSYLALTVGNTLPDNALSFYEDHYVLVGKNTVNLTNRDKLINTTIGALTTDTEYIRSFIKDITGVTITGFTSESQMYDALDRNEVTYVAVARMENIDSILSKKYWINYHLSDVKRYYYINDSSNGTLFQIMKKYYNNWEERNLKSNIYEQERDIFLSNLMITDAELDSLQKQTINYAYKTYVPYEVYGNSTYGGILGSYITEFTNFANLEIDYTKYSNDRRITRDINNNRITILSNFYNYTSGGTVIDTNIPINVGVFTHSATPFVMNSVEVLNGKTVYVEENSYLQTRLTSLNCTVETFKLSDIKKVMRDKENIILLDVEVGKYLQKTTLKDYDLRYTIDLETTYTLKSFGSDTLNKLLTNYINYLDNQALNQIGNYQGADIAKKGSLISSVATYALYAIIIVVLTLLLIYRSSKRVRLQKKIKKEDKLKFIDHLTSLKNRTYFNENLATWNKNTIYPQGVIVIDLNRVQEINDTLGYEEGDKQIKAAANVLIKTQLDNTDVMRTNGNEFVIYLVGYNQKQITSYIHKLYKEFEKDLPYKYGVCISYSMIEDNLKIIEDAVNECVEDIKKQKDKKDEEK